MNGNGNKAADAYDHLRAMEQEQRYYQDTHTLHVWEGGCPEGNHECTAKRVAAYNRVKAAQDAYDAVALA